MPKPSDLFLGVIEFFAVLVPGALLTWTVWRYPWLKLPDFIGPFLPKETAARWTAFALVSWCAGQILFGVGSKCVDPIWEKSRKRKRIAPDGRISDVADAAVVALRVSLLGLELPAANTPEGIAARQHAGWARQYLHRANVTPIRTPLSLEREAQAAIDVLDSEATATLNAVNKTNLMDQSTVQAIGIQNVVPLAQSVLNAIPDIRNQASSFTESRAGFRNTLSVVASQVGEAASNFKLDGAGIDSKLRSSAITVKVRATALEKASKSLSEEPAALPESAIGTYDFAYSILRASLQRSQR